jgi:hypothetical protein
MQRNWSVPFHLARSPIRSQRLALPPHDEFGRAQWVDSFSRGDLSRARGSSRIEQRVWVIGWNCFLLNADEGSPVRLTTELNY